MLAVLLDIIPAYRIRELNDAERKTKVSQAVARQRDYENGLVAAYKRYLELCEAEVDQSTPLKSVGLKCLCDLVRDKSGFNFSINIMDVIARQVSRAEWDEASVLCLETIIHIFETDSAGTDSLHLLRLLSRTIKSRSFKVHPALIASFLHLPLSSALSGVRASGERSSKDHPASIVKRKLDRKKQGDKPYFSKKARKAMEAKKEVEKEFAEAELAVSSEDLQSTVRSLASLGILLTESPDSARRR
jgi:nucleolar complex protein 3